MPWNARKKVDPPKLDRLEQIETFIGKLGEQMQTLATAVGQVVEGQNTFSTSIRQAVQRKETPAPPQPRVIEDASDAEIETALSNGTGASVFRKMVNAAIERRMDVIESRLGAHEEALVETSGFLSSSGEYPHKERYKDEIDAKLATVPVEFRRNPGYMKRVYKEFYDTVVGSHLPEIEQEIVERTTRSHQDAQALPEIWGPLKKPDKMPTPEEYLGPEGVEAIKAMYGNRPDAGNTWARDRGYSTLQDWVNEQIETEASFEEAN